VTDADGNVWAWEHTGAHRPGFEPTTIGSNAVSPVRVDPAFSSDDPATGKNEVNRTKRGIGAAPSAADLDGDGRLEIVTAALDRHVYAWHDDGTPVAGFPVLVVDPAKVEAVDPVTEFVTFQSGSGVREGGELITTPALADLTGDGRPEIIVGGQEQYAEPTNIGSGADVLALLGGVGTLGNGRLYAVSPDGTNASYPDSWPAHPDEQAYVPGWPAALGMLQVEALPAIGGGVSAQAVVGDVHASTGPEIVAASSVGPLYVLNPQGDSVYGTASGRDIPLAWSGGIAGTENTRFGAGRNSNDIVATAVAFGGPSLGRLDTDAIADITAPTAGLTRLIDISGSDLQLPNDDHLMAWTASNANALPGFPQTSPDLAFFVTPAIADLDGDGKQETIAGNGVFTLAAHDATGARPSAWPKLTGGWVVGTPGLGDWDGDGRAEVAVVRRDGVLLVWHTAGSASALTEWPRSGGGPTNSGRSDP
ncbi:MAG: FG-GAP repeat domain-containing protein, partial [Acidimicrobiia bacterium]